MNKSLEAFRTISEVAEELDIPKHVLRFWEVKFPQIKPMKRGGGRRYYRPEDVVLLRGIRNLLHAEGYTIKGVQKILREQGVEDVKAYAAAPRKKPRGGAERPAGADAKAVGAAGRVRELPKGKAAGRNKAPSSERDVTAQVDIAIRELKICRAALQAAGAAPVTSGAPPRRAARST